MKKNNLNTIIQTKNNSFISPFIIFGGIFSSLLLSSKIITMVTGAFSLRYDFDKSWFCHDVEFLISDMYSTMNFDKRSSVIKI
jgi:hypothetical protein